MVASRAATRGGALEQSADERVSNPTVFGLVRQLLCLPRPFFLSYAALARKWVGSMLQHPSCCSSEVPSLQHGQKDGGEGGACLPLTVRSRVST